MFAVLCFRKVDMLSHSFLYSKISSIKSTNNLTGVLFCMYLDPPLTPLRILLHYGLTPEFFHVLNSSLPAFGIILKHIFWSSIILAILGILEGRSKAQGWVFEGYTYWFSWCPLFPGSQACEETLPYDSTTVIHHLCHIFPTTKSWNLSGTLGKK